MPPKTGVPTTAPGARRSGAERIEYFGTENEALHRARELLDSGIHHGIAVYDDAGNALVGVRLQLKLGVCVAN